MIVAVPLKIIHDGEINFIPNLPQYKQDAIMATIIWEGYKAFIKFSNKFNSDEYVFNIFPSSAGENIYYNAAFGKNTTKNIIDLFVVGKPAFDFTWLSGDSLRDFILNELDEIYSNQATPSYIKHITQDYDNEPFIKAGYMTDNADKETVKYFGESVANKIYFASGSFTDREDWVSVHTAAESAKFAVDEIGS